MYAVLKSLVKIGQYEFTSVHEVEITRSVDSLGDTCTLKMPTSFVLGNKDQGFERKELETAVRPGDEVEVILGYEGIYEGIEFKGYVKRIDPNYPLNIECEDAIYIIRKKNCLKNFENTSLRKVVEYILEGTGVSLSADIPDVHFDSFLLKNVNGAMALEKIKDEYGLTAYIDNQGELFVGLREQQVNPDNVVRFHLQKNVVGSDLKFKNEEDVRLKVKAISHQPDNTTISGEFGDEDGELRTLHFYNIGSVGQLQSIAEAKLRELKYSGYEGSLTGFLFPFADRGYSVEVTDDKYPQRAGKYFVEQVKTTYGQNGARREISLGNKLSI